MASLWMRVQREALLHKQAVLNLFYKIMMLTIMIVIEISLLIIIIAHKNNNTIFNKAKMCI